MEKGAQAIELHLDQDFINTKNYWNEAIVKGVPIAAVHTPIIDGVDLPIENRDNKMIIANTCDFANKIAIKQNHAVVVIIHINTDPHVMKKLGVYDEVIDLLQILLDVCPGLDFAIENVGPYAVDRPDRLEMRAIQYDSAVQLVKDINNPRVGTCLDTCHALMTVRLMNNTADFLAISKEQSEDQLIRFGLKAYFQANKDVIKWMHLANCKLHGKDDDHGLPFTENDRNMLQEIVRLYNKYLYDCPVTIEVKEDDYADAQNFLTTYKELQKIGATKQVYNISTK